MSIDAMIKRVEILWVVVLMVILSTGKTCGQEFLDPDHYLVDSLEINVLSLQDKELIDSNITKFHAEKDDLKKLDHLMMIVEQSWNINVWPKYNKHVLKLTNEKIRNYPVKDSTYLKIIKIKAGALNNEAYVSQVKGNLDVAVSMYKECIRIFVEINDQKGVSQSRSNLASTYESMGLIELAIEQYHEALILKKSIPDSVGWANILHNIAGIYYNQRDFYNSAKYEKESLEMARKCGFRRGIASSLNNLASLEKENSNLTEAIALLHQSRLIQSEIGYDQGLAYSLNNLGEFYFRLEQFDSARFYIVKALDVRKKMRDTGGLIQSMASLAKYYRVRNQPDSALYFGYQAKKLAEETGLNLFAVRVYDILYTTYKMKGNADSALYYHEKFKEMQDSVVSDKTERAIAQDQAKYKYEKQKTIDDLENRNRVANEIQKQKQQRVVIVSISIAALVICVLLVIIYRRLRITNRQKLIIEEQKEEVETQRDQIETQKVLIEEKHSEIQESITYAKRIQTAILPPEQEWNTLLDENFVLYIPKDIVAGDFYWLHHSKDTVLFAVADCTGHGVPGAMVSVVCHGALNRCVGEYQLLQPAKILDKTRELVAETFEKSEEQVKDGMDIGLCAWNKKEGTLEFAGANNPIYVVRNEELEEIKGTKQPIGYVQNPIPFRNHRIELEGVSSVFLISDGYPDQFGGTKGKKFGHKQLRQMLLENHKKSMKDQKSILLDNFSEWIATGNEEQVDDVCVIGVRL